jgi:hypothetical protein
MGHMQGCWGRRPLSSSIVIMKFYCAPCKKNRLKRYKFHSFVKHDLKGVSKYKGRKLDPPSPPSQRPWQVLTRHCHRPWQTLARDRRRPWQTLARDRHRPWQTYRWKWSLLQQLHRVSHFNPTEIALTAF